MQKLLQDGSYGYHNCHEDYTTFNTIIALVGNPMCINAIVLHALKSSLNMRVYKSFMAGNRVRRYASFKIYLLHCHIPGHQSLPGQLLQPLQEVAEPTRHRSTSFRQPGENKRLFCL